MVPGFQRFGFQRFGFQRFRFQRFRFAGPLERRNLEPLEPEPSERVEPRNAWNPQASEASLRYRLPITTDPLKVVMSTTALPSP